MSNPSINLNSVPAEASLNDLLNLLKKEIFLDLNSHHLATVQSFDPTKQTITATINYQKTIFQPNAQGAYVPVLINYPLLQDVPVIVMSGGGANLTFPIKQGDQCVILFNDRSIDNWFQSGQVGPVSVSRFHSFADGLALVGLNSLNTLIQNYDPSRAVLRYGQTRVGVGTSLILLNNAANQSLGTILGNLLSALTNLKTALDTAFALPAIPASPLDPTWTASTASITTALNNVTSQLGALLE